MGGGGGGGLGAGVKIYMLRKIYIWGQGKMRNMHSKRGKTA